MNLTFETILEGDVPELTGVMTSAFDEDTRYHLGQEKGGPDGYDTGEFFRTWLFPYKESAGYKILLDGRIVGAFIVWILDGGHNNLGAIFVDPQHQRQGIGTKAWEFIERTYPDARSWKLETPAYAVRNHNFYVEKCGFRKVQEKPCDELPGGLFVYEKLMSQPEG